MKYKGIKVLEINPVVYLGEKFKNNDWRDNQAFFEEKIEDLNFEHNLEFECPIGDLIYIFVNYKDSLEISTKKDTINRILSVSNELMKVFGDNVKINICLAEYIEDGYNSMDISVVEFSKWLHEEVKKQLVYKN